MEWVSWVWGVYVAGTYLDIFHVVENLGYVFADHQGVITVFSVEVVPFVAVWIGL